MNADEQSGAGLVLTSGQRKYLRGLAHALQPVVWIGREGLSPAVLLELERTLTDHELIKVKFNEFKEEKQELAAEIVDQTMSVMAGMIGHVAIFYRPRPELEKRTIRLP
ncbi:MAG: ribosome assembly RNA-binding protein YhbY [Magnetococcales bacterium]|nr:ribosome assembly RNA-binding protein YhbY [Magnetococcales bacterium]